MRKDGEYSEKTAVVVYSSFDGSCPAFYRICPKCGRFVKADDKTQIPEYLGAKPNATCKKCGRVQMYFCGWFDEEVLCTKN